MCIDDTVFMIINSNAQVHSGTVWNKKIKQEYFAFSEVTSNNNFVFSLKY